MKIKRTVTKEMHIGELITYIFENDIKDKKFYDSRNPYGEGPSVAVDSCGWVRLNDIYAINQTCKFTVGTTEEIEVTDETKVNLVVIFNANRADALQYDSIKSILSRGGVSIKFIYLQNDDGSIGNLLWSKKEGLII